MSDKCVNKYRVNHEICFEALNWRALHRSLCCTYHIRSRSADRIIRSFIRRFKRPLNLYWFFKPMLSKKDEMLLSCICSYYGADSVVIRYQKPLRVGGFGISFTQRIGFSPVLSRKIESKCGTCTPEVTLNLFGVLTTVDSAGKAFALNLLFSLFAIILYVVGVGCLLYAISVFILFLALPAEVTIAATNNAAIGLALLSFLVGAAGIFGKAVSNLAKLWYGKLLKLRSKLRPLKSCNDLEA